jgi:hypothetical protein
MSEKRSRKRAARIQSDPLEFALCPRLVAARPQLMPELAAEGPWTREAMRAFIAGQPRNRAVIACGAAPAAPAQ